MDVFKGTDKLARIFWFGDGACVTTGFGRVAKSILVPLYKTGKYDIVQLGINYYGDPHSLPFRIFPLRYGDMYGVGRLYEVLKGMEPDVLITNNDIWAVDWVAKQLNIVRQELGKIIPWIHYFPLDGLPVKSEWTHFLRTSVDIPVAYTKWAVEEINKVDPLVQVEQIYHGVDTLMFYPDESIKQQFRKQLSKTWQGF